ncbi:MAG TPA: P1 family peptidase, partial [Gemmatimonadota bacterium]|nr:P1 family peptidase [Gemmatimonadota bacterium]
RRRSDDRSPQTIQDLPNESMSPLFQAVVEATEEAIYNSMLRAVTVDGHRGTAEALPIQETREVLERHGVLRR